jgi:hypothetical protein
MGRSGALVVHGEAGIGPVGYQPWFDNQRRLRALVTQLETLSQEFADTDPRGTADPIQPPARWTQPAQPAGSPSITPRQAC